MASMQDIVQTIKEKNQRIALIKKLIDRVDPAAGLTVYARLGVPHDDASHLAATGVAINVIDERFDVLDIMLKSERRSLEFWIGEARSYRALLGKAIDDHVLDEDAG